MNATILFWNRTFGCVRDLEYPAQLESVLRTRATETEILLPNFPEGSADDVMQLPAFFETQVDQPSKPPPDHHGLFQSFHAQTNNSPGRPSSSRSHPAGSAFEPPRHSTPKARLRHDDSQIQFAPIVSSSPAQAGDESQMLTEHQKEIKVRQHDLAQMFPDLSSSPVAQSTALCRGVQKRLDFSDIAAAERDGGVQGTPKALLDDAARMNDEIRSSPTPSSTRDVENVHAATEDNDETSDESQDLPSSPPRGLDDDVRADASVGREVRYHVGPDETTVDVTAATEAVVDSEPIDAIEASRTRPVSLAIDITDQHASDLPSDTNLPTMQLELEAEAAAVQQMQNLERASQAKDMDADVAGLPPSGQAPQSEAEDPRHEELADMKAEQHGSIDRTTRGGKQLTSPYVDVGSRLVTNATRIEDSFIGGPTSTVHGIENDQDNVERPRNVKKRKRPYTLVSSTKKRKSQSPLAYLSSFLGGRPAGNDDDDMDDEIVVASSQRSTLSVNKETQQSTLWPSKPEDGASQPSEEASVPVEETTAPGLSVKRGRGRPRKSETSTPALPGTLASRNLKRRASAISNDSGKETELSDSFAKDTSAPAQAKYQHGRQSTRSPRSSKLLNDDADSRPVSRRSLEAVVIPQCWTPTPHLSGAPDLNAMERYQDEPDSPDKQLALEESKAIRERAMATPKSILGRLRDALADCRKMILGPQEEREFDDVLFELRKSVHEAGSRGRRG